MKITQKEQIKTERLVLKSYSIDDRDSLCKLLMNKEIAKTFLIPEYQSIQEFYNLADKLIAFSQIEDEKHLEYGIYLRGNLIGFINDCGFNDKEIEIGYVIDPEYKGNGYATEAVTAVIDDLFEMGFEKIIAGFFEENMASRRVMEKSGMHLNGQTDTEIYRGKEYKCLFCEIVNHQVCEN